MSRYIDVLELEKRIKKNIKPETLEEKALIEWCKDECIRQALAIPFGNDALIRADTVRNMHSEIKKRCIEGGIYPAFVASAIDQIAKEMLE